MEPNPHRPFRLVLTFFEADGTTEIVLALASLSAYVKREIPDIEVFLEPIHSPRPEREHTPEGYAERLAARDPDLVGFTCLSPDWFALDPYLRAAREAVSETPLLLGGYQAILSSEQSIAHPALDYICVGDGELPLADLIRRLRGEHDRPVAGMWEKRADGGVIKSAPILMEDLSDLPLPDYTLYDQVGALRGIGMGAGERFALPVMSGRGCPYRCTYCCNTPLLDQWKGKGKYLRKYDPEALIAELKRLRDHYGVEYYEFWDELFMFNMRWVEAFLERYRDEVGVPFSINSRAEKMDEAFCRMAAEAGCDLIWFGIESGSDDYRHTFLNRKMTNQQVLSAAENCRKFGIRRLTFNIVGAPHESAEQMWETLQINLRIQPEYFFFFVYLPLRGTPLYELAEREGLLIDDGATDYQEGLRTGEYRWNLREHPGAASNEELAAVCREMEAFQQRVRARGGRLMTDEEREKAKLNEIVSKYRGLTFPLDVYAELLDQEEGRADYLHYGLFDGPDTPVREAQQNSTQLILERLPEAPSRILEIGIGFGTTYRTLTGLGHRVTGITPDERQIGVARGRIGGDPDLRCVRFEELSAEPGSFDLILFQESAQYIDPLDLFSRAFELLADGGTLLVIDEVALKRTEPGPAALHPLRDFVAQAERGGFRVEENIDLSAHAAPTCDYLLERIEQRREALRTALALEPSKIDGLLADLRINRDHYYSGRFGYALLRMVKGEAPRWAVREAGDADREAIRGLFGEVFGHPLSEPMWQWKYGDGRGHATLVHRDGELVAHYGGMAREILYHGEPQRAVQIGDVMVKGSERGVLTRRGPFFLSCATFLERHIGYGRRYLLGYGFPEARAMKVARRQGLYDEVGRMEELRWPALSGRPRLFSRLSPISEAAGERFAPAVDRCWSAMAATLGSETILGVRDWDYLRHRYFAHPQNEYEMVLVSRRFGGEPLGVVVLRNEGERCQLMDLVGAQDHFPIVIHHARRVAARLGAKELYFWVTEAQAGRFADASRVELDMRIPTSVWTEGPSPEALRGRWWLTAGDSDFR